MAIPIIFSTCATIEIRRSALCAAGKSPSVKGGEGSLRGAVHAAGLSDAGPPGVARDAVGKAFVEAHHAHYFNHPGFCSTNQPGSRDTMALM